MYSDKELPLISAKCITAGRIHCLKEAIYSFLIQEDSEDCEMVIVNDYEKQNIIFEHPRVRVYNIPPVPNIGLKENIAISLCRGKIIATWDDDDIALPHHIKNIKKFFDINKTSILHWRKGVYYEENTGKVSVNVPLGNSGIVYSKNAWEKSGFYPLENAGADQIFCNNIYKTFGYESVVHAEPEIPSWIYKWGQPMVYHLSGEGADTKSKKNVVQRHREYLQSIENYIPKGDVIIFPTWELNYKKLVEEHLKQQ